MIKLLSSVFSLYILLLTLSPCADKELMADHSVIDGTCSHDNMGHQDQNDCCSPFCTCSCCNLPCAVQKTFVDVQDHSLPQFLTFYFNPHFESSYRFSIWEPPKV